MQQVLVEIPRKKESYNIEFNAAEPTQFIGEVLEFTDSQTFKLNGLEIRVPGLSANTDNKLRTFATVMQVANAMFGGMEADAEAEPDSEIGQFVEGLRKAGFAISHNSKAAVVESVKIWLQLKRLRIQNHVAATRVLNLDKFRAIMSYRESNRKIIGLLNPAKKSAPEQK